MTLPHRGVLYPARLPTFHRLAAPDRVSALVGWFWIPEWEIAPGRASRQHLIAFPLCNLVVEHDTVGLAGPTTRASHRDLIGTGWAVGALLRPAAVPLFTDDAASIQDTYQPIELPDLHERVTEAMTGTARVGTAQVGTAHRRERAVNAFADWLEASAPVLSPEALLANEMADLIGGDPAILKVDDAAARLNVSARTLQRLARRYVGLTPLAMIRRRRLQEAAERLRTDPGTTLAAVAADLGYADHAHLANDFRTVLGFTLTAYRRQVSPPVR